MAWVFRPFLGDPRLPVAFVRSEAWGNACVVVAKLLVHAVNRTGVAPLLWAWLMVGVLPLALIFAGFYVSTLHTENIPCRSDRIGPGRHRMVDCSQGPVESMYPVS